MRNRWLKILSALFTLFLLLFLFLYILNKVGNYRNTDTIMNRVLLQFFSNNKVLVQSKQLDKISITWRSGRKKKKIIENGRVKGYIENIYGPQVFDIFRNDTMICSMTQSKTAWWHTHNYVFIVDYDTCKCEIVGPDE
jgi:hypothetical protein